MSSTANLSPAVPTPEHIPESLVYDFDMFLDPAMQVDPHKRVYDLVQNVPPIFWTPRNEGHWVFLSHSANFNASRDTETFSNEVIPQAIIKQMMAQMPPGSPHIPQPIPINVDPPEHGKYRTPLNRVFSPKAIAALKDDIRKLADDLIDDIIADGACEFMSSIAEPLPVQVFLKMLGLPLDRQAEYRELVRDHLSESNSEGNMAAKLMRITASMRDTLLARKEEPQDDIISMLWKLEIDGEPMTLADMENYCVLLFIAGLDTVMNGIGHGIRHIAQDPSLQADLRKDPALIAEVTEELLRRYTFTVPPRRVDKDVVFEGVTMKAGDKVMLYLPAADLDPNEFAKPDTFDLKRENKVHIAFNAGPHRCLGSHLARVELQIVYEQMLARLPEFRLDPARPAKFHSGHVIGVDELHLLWKI
ncbi:cytochrome P450 [Zhongshania sp.]|uniref:cytochrome P450 n=1 Tax=Zhongshania sp. TaxID=1971902 RepID=UPI003566C3B9